MYRHALVLADLLATIPFSRIAIGIPRAARIPILKKSGRPIPK